MTKSKASPQLPPAPSTPSERTAPEHELASQVVLQAAFAASSSPELLRQTRDRLKGLLAVLDGALVALEGSASGASSTVASSTVPRVPHADGRVKEGLSPREVEIVRHFATGNTVTAIAQNVGISPHTVRNHLKAIYRKTSVHTSIELMNFAIAKGIVTL